MSAALGFGARLFALLAGAVVVAIAGLTCWSVTGRSFFNSALIGDFELVQVAMVISVAGFMPICQFENGNIIVDFFTQRATARTRAALDRFGALAVAAMMGLLAWRASLGAREAFDNAQVTMMMQFPEWIPYSATVPPLAWTSLIALYQAATGRLLARGD